MHKSTSKRACTVTVERVPMSVEKGKEMGIRQLAFWLRCG